MKNPKKPGFHIFSNICFSKGEKSEKLHKKLQLQWTKLEPTSMPPHEKNQQATTSNVLLNLLSMDLKCLPIC